MKVCITASLHPLDVCQWIQGMGFLEFYCVPMDTGNGLLGVLWEPVRQASSPTLRCSHGNWSEAGLKSRL